MTLINKLQLFRGLKVLFFLDPLMLFSSSHTKKKSHYGAEKRSLVARVKSFALRDSSKHFLETLIVLSTHTMTSK